MNLTRSDIKKSEKFEEEKSDLINSVKISKIFDYIIELIELYADLKSENKKEEKKKDYNIEMTLESQQEGYESLIRKLESDLRNHMKVLFK